MAAWLDAGHLFNSKVEHTSIFGLFLLPHETRMEARRVLMMRPGAAALASYERGRRQGEGPEPDGWA